MSNQNVPPQHTPISAEQLYGALTRAWPSVVGGTANRASLLVLLAQSALETGAWKSLYNYNLGNVKHVQGDGYDFFSIRCNEFANGQEVWSQCQFRAYPNLDTGAQDYLAFLVRRFRTAWSAVEDGDPDDFVHRLKAAGYFTSSESDYQAGVRRYFDSFSNSITGALAAVPKKAASVGAIVLGGLSVGVIGYYVYLQRRKYR